MGSDNPLTDQGVERRKETRYPVEAKVMVRKNDGEAIQAMAVDISSSGMRLKLDGPGRLYRDDQVTVQVELADRPEHAFSAWGLGRVSYVGDGIAGIQLFGGEFDAEGAAGIAPDQGGPQGRERGIDS